MNLFSIHCLVGVYLTNLSQYYQVRYQLGIEYGRVMKNSSRLTTVEFSTRNKRYTNISI
jgi:hypothetical protein